MNQTRSTIYKRTHYWMLEFLCDLELIYEYFVIQNIEILGLLSKQRQVM